MEQLNNDTINVKMILHLENSRVDAIRRAKHEQDLKELEHKKPGKILSSFPVNTGVMYSCVESLKKATPEQLFELRFGKSIDEARAEAKQHFKKEKL